MILLFEDEEFNARLIQRALRGKHIIWCESRETLLSTLTTLPRRSIELVLADREIGGRQRVSQGALVRSNEILHILQLIRSHPVIAPSAILLVWSGVERPQAIAQVRDSGLADGFLAKSRLENIADDIESMVTSLRLMQAKNPSNQRLWLQRLGTVDDT